MFGVGVVGLRCCGNCEDAEAKGRQTNKPMEHRSLILSYSRVLWGGRLLERCCVKGTFADRERLSERCCAEGTFAGCERADYRISFALRQEGYARWFVERTPTRKELYRGDGLVAPLYEDWPISEDGIFGRAVTIYQHQKGYRFSLDAVLLAAFAVERALLLKQRIFRPLGAVDLCTGSGIVPLAALFLADRIKDSPSIEGSDLFGAWSAVDVQASMVSLARANIRANQRDETLSLVHADLRVWRPERPAEIITCNPPYQPVSSGDVSRHPERAIARHEIQGELAEIAEAARTMVPLEGVSLWVFPAERSARLLGVLQRAGWRVTHLRWVHPFEDAPAALVLIEAQSMFSPHDESGAQPTPSLSFGASEEAAKSAIQSRCVLQHEHRVYTPMIEALLQGDPFLWLEQ